VIALGALSVLFATSASAGALLSLEGIWVSAEARRLVQAGGSGDPGCFLEVSAEGSVLENCAEGIHRWPRVTESVTPGAAELRSESPDGVRHAVVRAGAPAEMELRIEQGGTVEYRRLYRLDPRHLPALRNLVLVRDRLLGDWTTEDGVPLRFDADGTYVFGGDAGRYRLRGGLSTPGGAWGVLFFEPKHGGPTRRYLLHGRGHRLGLAEIPLDVELVLPEPGSEASREGEEGARSAVGTEEPAQEEVRAEAAVGERPRDGREAGAAVGERPYEEREAEAVVVEGVRIPLPEEEDEPEVAVLPAGVEEPEPRIWFDRARPLAAEAASGNGEDPGEKEGEAEEPPPIARPIRPARKCGCQAGEAAAGLVLVGPWLVGRERRRS